MYMLLDTGASTTWVMGSSCTAGACLIHNLFDPSDSTTNVLVTGAAGDFNLAYGSGSTTGQYSVDTFAFAGMTLNMTFGLANYTSDDFTAFPMDGILGLSQANNTFPTFLQTVVAAGDLTANVFGVSLSRASDGSNTGEITFGAPDTSKYSGGLTYSPVQPDSDGDWVIPMDGVAFGTQDAGLTGRNAYFDTGTSYIFGPPDDVAALHALIEGAVSSDQVTYYVPCTTTESVVLTFSGIPYSISTADWVGPSVNGQCTSNIYGRSIVGDSAWLVGDTFLKNVYSLYDNDNNQIGMLNPINKMELQLTDQ